MIYVPNFLSIHNVLNMAPHKKSLIGAGQGYDEARGLVYLANPTLWEFVM
jgi:hypothetical protein